MKFYLIIITYLLLSASLHAQTDTSNAINQVDVDFLLNYYDQTGTHAAVTGGRGSEELTDISGDLIINVVVDSLRELDFKIHLNHYSSASTDAIDSRMSSASSKDNRFSIDSEYTFTKPNWKWKHTYGAGFSIESDYVSTHFKAVAMRISNNNMNEYAIGTNLYFDKWVIIYPEEIRGTDRVSSETDNRNTYQLYFGSKHLLNKKTNLAFSVSPSLQHGILSTPFHRVYFIQDSLPKNEQLPGNRIRIPLELKINTFLSDYLILKFASGIYYDNFGIKAVHAQVKAPVKSNLSFMFYPFYRFYTQSESDYFKPYKEHSNTSKYFTSDYDLSGFTSHKVGIGTRIKPLYGIGGNKNTNTMGAVKGIDLRVAYYLRSDGLSAWMVGSMFDF